jgi:aerobic carbon-monoxide dehydrogenase large subunit
VTGQGPFVSAYGPVRRKEDARFIRGRGTFVDDVQLPGMLHGAILRSPLAHARIRSVDPAAAQAHPKVRAVITGQTLAARNLAWMPTLSRDVQAVLATERSASRARRSRSWSPRTVTRRGTRWS